MREAPPRQLGDLTATMVLFDWNGTIVLDSERARQSLNAVLEPRGIPPLDDTQFGRRFRLPMAQMFRELGVHASELDASESEWNHGMLLRPAAARPGTAQTLLALGHAGAWLGVVSAAGAASVDNDLSELGIPAVWDAIETSVPDKLAVLKNQRGRRERAFYVGDTEYDIRCAREADYVAVGVAGGYTAAAALLAAGADFLITDLAELLDIVDLRE